jgi:hypothetical protein
MQELAEQTKVILLDSEAKGLREAELAEQPIVSYSDETRNIKDSTLWVWTDGGLPVAFQKIEVNESVSDLPRWTFCVAVTGEKRIELNWPSRERFVGEPLTFRPLASAPRPETDERLRRLQMRQLSRRFSVRAHNGLGESELRLMARPVFEYSAPEQGVLQGAMFAFAVGTNPDLLVAIQLQGSEAGEERWTCAPVRLTSGRIVLRYDDQPVWEDELSLQPGDFPHWCWFHTPRRDGGQEETDR